MSSPSKVDDESSPKKETTDGVIVVELPATGEIDMKAVLQSSLTTTSDPKSPIDEDSQTEDPIKLSENGIEPGASTGMLTSVIRSLERRFRSGELENDDDGQDDASTTGVQVDKRRKEKISKEERELVKHGKGWVDDSDLQHAEVLIQLSKGVKTAHSGFYVNRGPLETTVVEPGDEASDGDDDGFESSSKNESNTKRKKNGQNGTSKTKLAAKKLKKTTSSKKTSSKQSETKVKQSTKSNSAEPDTKPLEKEKSSSPSKKRKTPSKGSKETTPAKKSSKVKKQKRTGDSDDETKSKKRKSSSSDPKSSRKVSTKKVKSNKKAAKKTRKEKKSSKKKSKHQAVEDPKQIARQAFLDKWGKDPWVPPPEAESLYEDLKIAVKEQLDLEAKLAEDEKTTIRLVKLIKKEMKQNKKKKGNMSSKSETVAENVSSRTADTTETLPNAVDQLGTSSSGTLDITDSSPSTTTKIETTTTNVDNTDTSSSNTAAQPVASSSNAEKAECVAASNVSTTTAVSVSSKGESTSDGKSDKEVKTDSDNKDNKQQGTDDVAPKHNTDVDVKNSSKAQSKKKTCDEIPSDAESRKALIAHANALRLPPKDQPAHLRDRIVNNRLPKKLESVLIPFDIAVRSWPTNADTDRNNMYLAALMQLLPFTKPIMIHHLKRLRARDFVKQSEASFEALFQETQNSIMEQISKPDGLKRASVKHYEFVPPAQREQCGNKAIELLKEIIAMETKEQYDEKVATQLILKVNEILRKLIPQKKLGDPKDARKNGGTAWAELGEEDVVGGDTSHVKNEENGTSTNGDTKDNKSDDGTSATKSKSEHGEKSKSEVKANESGNDTEAATASTTKDLNSSLLESTTPSAQLEELIKVDPSRDPTSFKEFTSGVKVILVNWLNTHGIDHKKAKQENREIGIAMHAINDACVMCSRGATLFLSEQNAVGKSKLAFVWDERSKRLIYELDTAQQKLFLCRLKYFKFRQSYQIKTLRITTSLPEEKAERAQYIERMLAMWPKHVLIRHQGISNVIRGQVKRQEAEHLLVKARKKVGTEAPRKGKTVTTKKQSKDSSAKKKSTSNSKKVTAKRKKSTAASGTKSKKAKKEESDNDGSGSSSEDVFEDSDDQGAKKASSAKVNKKKKSSTGPQPKKPDSGSGSQESTTTNVKEKVPAETILQDSNESDADESIVNSGIDSVIDDDESEDGSSSSNSD